MDATVEASIDKWTDGLIYAFNVRVDAAFTGLNAGSAQNSCLIPHGAL